MGWLYGYGWDTKARMVAHLRGPALGEGVTTLASCVVGNVMWSVLKPQDGDAYIACFLLGYGRRDRIWGYKDMTESMGPAEVSCPLSYLAMAPEPPGEGAKGWRERVRMHQARKDAIRKRPIEAGKTYALLPNNKGIARVTVTSVRPLRGVSEGGLRCRLPRKLLGDEAAG